MSNDPLARTKTRPMYLPCLVPLVTTARMISPVWKPLTFLVPLGFEQGKPIALTLHFCLLPCPVAVISRGTTPARYTCSGVLLPTQTASIQCAFGSCRTVLLNVVRPPEPHSTGSP